MLFVIDLELLDSSVIVAWLNPRDACHGRVERIELGASVVNEICLAEVSSAIRRITGKPAQASKAVALIPARQVYATLASVTQAFLSHAYAVESALNEKDP